MKIEYICHSSLFIDTGDTTIVTDPWIKGTAYKGQWFLFPPPINIAEMPDVKNVLITHGHDDHLHEESLQFINKRAHLFFPYQWKKGVGDYLNSLGFNDVTETITYTTYQISPSTKITYIGFSLESIIVIESNGKVIVNLNDALNSHHENIVQKFLKEIKKRWNVIDYLFSGWSGAGYFPNTVHYKNKDDAEIGKLREQYFANNFCRFIKYLEPKRAMPFAPGFALLAEDKRWINEIKFSRNNLEQYYRENFDKDSEVEFIVMQPGDYFENDELHSVSPYQYQEKNDSLYHLVDEIYHDEINIFNTIKYVDENRIINLKERMEKVLNDNSILYDKVVLNDVNFTLILTDVKENNHFNISRIEDHFIVERNSLSSANSKLIIKTTSHLLNFSFEKEWGADAMTIGYGIDVEVFEELTLEKNLDIVCVRLLSRYPRATDYLYKQPFRTLKWLFTNPVMASLAIKQKFLLKSAVNKYPYNERDHWISYSKCELCKVCNMPELSVDFGRRLDGI